MSKQIIGTVSSNKGDKTIVVTVQERKTHPLYRKQYTTTKKFMAHDEKNEAQIGDKVVIVESRPLSARKRHTLSEIVERPALREESLVATKEQDSAQRPDSKSKQTEADSEEKA